MKWVAVLLVVLMGSEVKSGDKIVVPMAYRNVAQAYGIPYKILFAIGMQESQRDVGNGHVLPWPWTLNINGDGKYFETSMQMQKALFDAMDHGVRNIDVGLMQINIKWHLGKSYSLIDLMRPEDNLNIAAQILRDEHNGCGGTDYDWMCAIGRYHSRREARAENYTKQVMRWVSDLW